MLDTKLMAMVTAHAHDAGAKLILVGDDRQLSSIDRGGMFGVLKDRHGAAELTEVKRQHKIDERRATEIWPKGIFMTRLASTRRRARSTGRARRARPAPTVVSKARQRGSAGQIPLCVRLHQCRR